MPCYLADSPHGCFEEHRRRLLKIRYPGELIPCSTCTSARPNAIAAYVPEPDEVHGPKTAATCRQGHSRAIYGRKQTKGRDIGSWTCKECERIRHEKFLERQKYKCITCGKVIRKESTQCLKCFRKDKKAAQPVHCTVEGCRAKSRRRGLCATHYWKARGEAKLEQRKERHREACARYRDKKEAVA